jgi:hypothetical protein
LSQGSHPRFGVDSIAGPTFAGLVQQTLPAAENIRPLNEWFAAPKSLRQNSGDPAAAADRSFSPDYR